MKISAPTRPAHGQCIDILGRMCQFHDDARLPRATRRCRRSSNYCPPPRPDPGFSRGQAVHTVSLDEEYGPLIVASGCASVLDGKRYIDIRAFSVQLLRQRLGVSEGQGRIADWRRHEAGILQDPVTGASLAHAYGHRGKSAQGNCSRPSRHATRHSRQLRFPSPMGPVALKRCGFLLIHCVVTAAARPRAFTLRMSERISPRQVSFPGYRWAKCMAVRIESQTFAKLDRP